MRWNMVLIYLLTFFVALGRFFVPGHALSLNGTYEALAHIWVGVLIALIFVKLEFRKVASWLLVLITTLETWMFLHR
jgi:hypothetical protein